MGLFQENVVIVDRGSHELRALLVRRGMGTFDILKKETLPALPAPDGDMDTGSYNLLRFIQTLFPDESVFYLSLTGTELFTRNVDLPTDDARLAAEILPGDLEPLLPVALEDVEVVATCWQRAEGQSRMTAFAVEKQQMEALADSVIKSGKTIGYMAPGAHMLASAVQLLPEEDRAGVIAQLDIGLYGSTLNLLYDGRLAFTRNLPIGGADFTAEIADQLGISLEEAERFKIESGLDISRKEIDEIAPQRGLTSAKLRRMKQALLRLVKEMAAEIDRSILASPLREPSHLYISGGGSLLGGITEALEEQTNIRFRRYPLLLAEEAVDRWIFCLGMMHASGGSKEARLDFLQTPTGGRLRSAEVRWKPFIAPGIVAASATIILLFSFIIGIVSEQRQLSELRGQMQEVAKGIAGINPRQNPVRAARDLCQKRLRVMRSVLGGYRVLDILKEVTEHTPDPSRLQVKFRSLSYDESAMDLELELDNVNQIVAVQEHYQNSKMFSAVEVVRPDIIGGRKARLRLKLILKPVANNLEVNCR